MTLTNGTDFKGKTVLQVIMWVDVYFGSDALKIFLPLFILWSALVALTVAQSLPRSYLIYNELLRRGYRVDVGVVVVIVAGVIHLYKEYECFTILGI